MSVLNRSYVESVFGTLSSNNPMAFFDHVTNDVDWTVTGDANPLYGRWHDKQQYLDEVWSRTGSILTQPMMLSVAGVVVQPEGEGLEGTASVELRGVDGVMNNGGEYNNEYCWVVGFNAEGKIAVVRAYLDSAKLRDAFEVNQ